MTKEERALAQKHTEYTTVECHKYTSINGHTYYKLKQDGKPLSLIKCSTFERMEQRVGIITGSNSLFTLNLEQLRANYFDWQTRKDKRTNRKPRKSKVEPENIF